MTTVAQISQQRRQTHEPPRGNRSSQLNVQDVVKSYNTMHKAVEHNTKYYRVDPIQYIFLRRGSQWRPMLVKITACGLGLFFTAGMSASSY